MSFYAVLQLAHEFDAVHDKAFVNAFSNQTFFVFSPHFKGKFATGYGNEFGRGGDGCAQG